MSTQLIADEVSNTTNCNITSARLVEEAQQLHCRLQLLGYVDIHLQVTRVEDHATATRQRDVTTNSP